MMPTFFASTRPLLRTVPSLAVAATFGFGLSACAIRPTGTVVEAPMTAVTTTTTKLATVKTTPAEAPPGLVVGTARAPGTSGPDLRDEAFPAPQAKTASKIAPKSAAKAAKAGPAKRNDAAAGPTPTR